VRQGSKIAADFLKILMRLTDEGHGTHLDILTAPSVMKCLPTWTSLTIMLANDSIEMGQ